MQKINAIEANISFFPEWAKFVVLNLVGVYVILQLIHLIIKKLQTTELRTAISALKYLSGEALRKAGRALELPVERPKFALFSLVLNTALFYVFTLIFFAWFGVFFILNITTSDMPALKRLLAICVPILLICASRWYYVSAERQRIALVERWRLWKSHDGS